MLARTHEMDASNPIQLAQISVPSGASPSHETQSMPVAGSVESMGWLLVTIAALATAVNQTAGLIRRVAGKTEVTTLSANPLVVEPAEQYAPAEEVATLKMHLEQIRAQIKSQEENLRKEVRTDVSELHEKINAIAVQVASCTASQTFTQQTLIQIGTKLDRLIEKQNE